MNGTSKCPDCKDVEMIEIDRGVYQCKKCGKTLLTNDSNYLQMVKKILEW